MKLRSFLIAGLATLAMASSSYATGLGRCENLPDIVTADNAPVDRERIDSKNPPDKGSITYVTNNPLFDPMCGPRGTCVPESLSEQSDSTLIQYVTADGVVLDILVHKDGTLDVKDTTKAYAKAVIQAILAHQPIPAYGPQYEVVDWNAPTEGSHCD